MVVKLLRKLQLDVRKLRLDNHGNVAMTFALALIPIMTGVGAAVDYSRANSAKSKLQSALDGAILAGGNDGSSNWTQVASNVFSGNIGLKTFPGTVSPPNFNLDSNSTYVG